MPGLILSQNTINLTGIVSQTLTPIGFALSVGRGAPSAGISAPFLVENFAWATSTANLQSSAADISNGGNWITAESDPTRRLQATLDKTVGYAPLGLTQSMLYTWPSDAVQDYGVGLGFMNVFKGAQHSGAAGTVTELWWKVIATFDPGFTVFGDKTGAPEYKLFLGGSYWDGGTGRWNMPEAQDSQWDCNAPYPASYGGTADFLSNSTPFSGLWDGSPHVYTGHMKLSPGANNGINAFAIDGVTIINATGFPTDPSNTAIQIFRLGANLNKGTAAGHTTNRIWWHYVAFYDQNPGWGI